MPRQQKKNLDPSNEKKPRKSQKPEKPVIGQSFQVEDFRLMQQVKGTPSDFEGIARKREAIAMHDVKKDRDWFPILLGIGIMVILICIGMIFLGKAEIDMSGIFGGAPPVQGTSELTAMITGVIG
jgi:hypothetical protein